MPNWLSITVGCCAVLSFIFSIYTIVSKKRTAALEDIKNLKSDMLQVKKVTDAMEEYMQELLLESLRGKK